MWPISARVRQGRSRLWLIALVLIALVAAGCDDDDDAGANDDGDDSETTTTAAAGDSTDDALAELVAAAQAEGEVHYQSTTAESVNDAVVEEFEREYGIEVVAERVAGSDLIQRFGAEATAGDVSADLLIFSGPAEVTSADWLESGWISPLPGEGLPALESGDFPSEMVRTNSVVAMIMPWGYWYNTDAVGDDEVPTTWQDLADPRWQGELLQSDPSVSDTYLELYSALLNDPELGEEWFEAVRSNRGQLIPGGIQMIEAVGAGQGEITGPAGAQSGAALIEQGAPIDVVVPEKNVGIEFHMVLPAEDKVAHPNAARLLANWLLSEEGSEVLTRDDLLYSPYDYTEFLPDYIAPDPEQAQADKQRIYDLLGV